jgi:hypothetical protein
MVTPPTEALKRANLIAWFERYRVSRIARDRVAQASLKQAFDRIKVELEPLQARAVERWRDEAPEFNIFRILRIARREVIFHTPFLANLLTPSGSHAQGELFLQLFFERLHTKSQSDSHLRADTRWSVLTEQVTDSGNFDIHLRCRPFGCQVVVENKIDAVDQHNQLSRYWAQMGKELAHFPHRLLVYLTPRDRTPNPGTAGLPPHVNLTYQDDIRAVLVKALSLITAPRLSHSLQQYLEIVESL